MKKIHVMLLSALCAVMMIACSPADRLERAIEGANQECPLQADEVTTITSITIEENNVVSHCVIDESSEYDASVERMDTPETRAKLKEAILHNFQTAENSRELAALCKEAGYNIVYRFVGSVSGHTFDIVCPADEL